MYRKILLILLIASVAYAANFGSSVKVNSILIKENQTAEFSLLLWTADQENHTVTLKILDYPENWTVSLESENIIISRTQGNEMVYSSEYLRATTVKVFANPNGERAGKYNIIVLATKLPETGSIVIAQERVFNLSVEIEGRPNQIQINVPADQEEGSGSSSLNFMVLGLIVFISALIYRYS